MVFNTQGDGGGGGGAQRERLVFNTQGERQTDRQRLRQTDRQMSYGRACVLGGGGGRGVKGGDRGEVAGEKKDRDQRLR